MISVSLSELMRIPLSVRSVAHVIGMEGAVRLMQATSTNRQVYVPSKEHGANHLASVLRPDELRLLCREFGGSLMHYPSARSMKRRRATQIKAQAILKDLSAGYKLNEVAMKHEVSPQYVSRLRTHGCTSSQREHKRKNERDSQV
jgi:hypothetical protein